MKKTLIPNSIIVFSTIYFTIMLWGFTSTENRVGLLFYAFILPVFIITFIYLREPNVSILKIENYQLKVKYIFPNKKDIEIDLYKIKGNITLRRFHGRDFAGGFPTWADYLNFRWYFTAEKYELELLYFDEIMIIPFQTNIIGLKSFLDSVIMYANAINDGKITYNKSNLAKIELSQGLSELAIKLLIER